MKQQQAAKLGERSMHETRRGAGGQHAATALHARQQPARQLGAALRKHTSGLILAGSGHLLCLLVGEGPAGTVAG